MDNKVNKLFEDVEKKIFVKDFGSAYGAYALICEAFKKMPESREEILNKMNTCIQLNIDRFDIDKNDELKTSDSLLTAVYSLGEMMKDAPEFRKDIWKSVKHIVQSDKMNESHLATACVEIGEMMKIAPELRKDVWKSVKTIWQSNEIDWYRVNTMKGMPIAEVFLFEPELRKDIWTTMKEHMQADKDIPYDDLGKMFISAPEMRNDIWNTTKNFTMERGDFKESCFTMAEMFVFEPNLRKDILNTMKTELPLFLQKFDNDGGHCYGYFLGDYYQTLNRMFNRAPEYGKDIYEIMKIGVCSGKNIINDGDYEEDAEGNEHWVDFYVSEKYKAYPTLLEITKKYPELKEDFQNMKKDAKREEDKTLFKFNKLKNKQSISERIAHIKERKEAVSGAVVADEIAGKRRSGEIKEPVTPEKGNKLSAEIQAKIKDMKGNTKD